MWNNNFNYTNLSRMDHNDQNQVHSQQDGMAPAGTLPAGMWQAPGNFTGLDHGFWPAANNLPMIPFANPVQDGLTGAFPTAIPPFHHNNQVQLPFRETRVEAALTLFAFPTQNTQMNRNHHEEIDDGLYKDVGTQTDEQPSDTAFLQNMLNEMDKSLPNTSESGGNHSNPRELLMTIITTTVKKTIDEIDQRDRMSTHAKKRWI
uniref:Uncharacterized protein n=1 Tax=Panagrolaimus sp. JU765 TaxID=591449 RepID=A0AC34RA49_9BILA